MKNWTARLTTLAIAAAIAVSVIYLPQPMIVQLAQSMGVDGASAGLTATAVQVGYAIGIFLLVPLSERVQPRRQVTVQSVALAAALTVTALSPGPAAAVLSFFGVGLVANIAQLLIPAAGKLSPPDRRGATTAALVGAMVCGIFGGRIVASMLVALIGWRWVLVIFAGAVLLMIPFVRAALGADVPLSAPGQAYGRLLRTTLRLEVTSRTLRLSAAMQFFAFAAFNAIWTAMALHLTSPPYDWSVTAAGLFGLVGLAAGLVTPLGGRFVDRYGSLPVVVVFAGLMLGATSLTIVYAQTIWALAVTSFLLTWANQSMQAANQNQILIANPDASAHANTVYMVCVFLGGSVGAFAGPLAFARGGMAAVAATATVLVAVSLIVWLTAIVTGRSAHQSPLGDGVRPASPTKGTRP